MGRQGAMEAVRSGAANARGQRPGRSGPDSAARYELHQQQPNVEAAHARRVPHVVAGLARVAPGPSVDLRVFHLMSVLGAWRDGTRRVHAAPLLVLGMYALTLFVALPLSIALRGMIEAQLGDSLAA